MPHRVRCLVCFIVVLLASAAAFSQSTPLPLLPSGIAYDAAGNLYLVDTQRNQVLEATLGGQLLVVAGNGTQGFAGDGGPATAAELNAPQAIAIDAAGSLYIADTGNDRIRIVQAGVMSTFVGNGTRGFSGDNGPATAAALRHPSALAISPSGDLLLADTGNQRVRRISGGIIATIAGNGVQGFAGDGAAATSAELDSPEGLAAAADGRIFIADAHNQRIRVVSSAGTLTTMAGTGTAGFSGDGGPATQARLNLPRGLALTSAGGLIFADSNNQRLRVIDAQGNISTLAGSGTQGYSPDATPAATAALNNPRFVAISSFANPVFADTANRLARVLAPGGQIFAPAAMAPTRTSTVTLQTIGSNSYGQLTASVAVSGSAGTPQGTVQVMDGGNVIAQASLSAAAATVPLPSLLPGAHQLTAVYLGDGLNPAATSAVANISVGTAATTTTEQTPVPTYAGLPLVVQATVSSSAQGTPTGTVNFLEGNTVVASATIAGSVATGTVLNAAAGSHTLVATYQGDAKFSASTSPAVTAVVNAMPDFAISLPAGASQTVQGGLIATYALSIAPQPGPFSGDVVLSASNIPVGATVSFSPSQVIPGTSPVSVTMNVTTTVAMAQATRSPLPWLWLAMLLPAWCWRLHRKHRWAVYVLTICAAATMASLAGCGARTLSEGTQAAKTYSFTVTGTSTNLAGVVVTHSAPVTLIVE